MRVRDAALILILSATTTAALPNGLALAPPRGFATWNIYPFTPHKPPGLPAINESYAKHLAQALYDQGLAAAGYEYFVVQEPCFNGRDNVTGELSQGGEFGRRWPGGMRAFGEFLNARGMRLGIYTDIADTTCGGCVGSGPKHVDQDMQTFADWGADFVEVDACNGPVDESTWAHFRDAINKTGRPMVHSVCAEGMDQAWKWGARVGNMWRVTGDIQNNWLAVLGNYDIARSEDAHMERYAAPGGWNDLDMIEVGVAPRNVSWGGPGLSLAESRSHLSLWALLKSPMLIAADASELSAEKLELLKNDAMLAISADRLGVQGRNLDANFPGSGQGPKAHALAKPARLQPCDIDDPQQRWGTGQMRHPIDPPDSYGQPFVRSEAASTMCLSAPGCTVAPGAQPVLRKCLDWEENCPGFPCGLVDQGFDLVPLPDGGVGLAAHANVSNTSHGAEPGGPPRRLCLAALGGIGSVPTLEECADPAEAGLLGQRWSWNRPHVHEGEGTQIQWLGTSGGVDGAQLPSVALCLSSSFTPTEMNEVVATPLAGGDQAVALFNRASLPRSMWVDVARLAPPTDGFEYEVQDVWARRSLGRVPSHEMLLFTVPAHDTVMLRLNRTAPHRRLLALFGRKGADRVAASKEEEIAQQHRALRCRPLINGLTKGAFTKCMREVAAAPETHVLFYRPKHACAHLGHCNGRGDCFLGKCFCGPGFAGEQCEDAKQNRPSCSLLSDACFRSHKHGRAHISMERWQRASWAEESWWSSSSVTSSEQSDNGAAMTIQFKQYRMLPDRLGHVLELGCGPYTQLREILAERGRRWSVDTVTLADPILVFESKHRFSAFQTGKFVDRAGRLYPTTLHQVGAEAVGSLYHDAFDTVIMMNVLEHVASAYEVLESLYNVTKPGGIVVLWEPTYSVGWSGWKERGDELLLDTSLPISPEIRQPDWGKIETRNTVRSRGFDMMAHPIRIDPSILEYFASHFEPIEHRQGAGRRGDSSMTLVGRKRARGTVEG